MRFYKSLLILGMVGLGLAYIGCSKKVDLESSKLDYNVPSAMVHNIPGTQYSSINAQLKRIDALSRLGIDTYLSIGILEDGSKTCDLRELERQIQSELPNQEEMERIIQETNARLNKTCSKIDQNEDKFLEIKEIDKYQLNKCEEMINPQIQHRADVPFI